MQTVPLMKTGKINVPGLDWRMVMLFSILTLGLFEDIWLIRQSRWAKKVDPKSRATPLLVLPLLLLILGAILSRNPELNGIAGWIDLAAIVCGQVGNFSIKGTMEKYYHLSLSGLKTIFFGAIYFQYHFDRLVKESAPVSVA